MSYQQVQPIDLDAFNQNTSALGLQAVGASLASSPAQPGSKPLLETPAPALAGTQPTFSYNPITPIPTTPPTQTPSPVSTSPLTAPGIDPSATSFHPFMAFRPAPLPVT